MLACAVISALGIRWSTVHRLKPLYKMAIALGLFAYGGLFAIACILLLGRHAPDPSALVAAAWWWPVVLGYAVVLLVGMVAWLGQARLTEVVPGARGARAVGSIFGISALGAASYFVAPILLLEESRGLVTVGLFSLNAVSLAVLFAFAIRSGPPVPTYFALGPVLLVPGLSTSLLMGLPEGLWGSTISTVVLYVLAIGRHRWAVSRGSEECEYDEQQAAIADAERLQKLQSKLKR